MHFLGVVLQQLLDGLARTVRWSVHSVAVEKEGALQYIGIPNSVGLVAGSFEDLLLHYQFKQLKEAQDLTYDCPEFVALDFDLLG